MERVESKSLFNNQLSGVVDPEIAELNKKNMAKYAEMMKDSGNGEEETAAYDHSKMTCPQAAEFIRSTMDLFIVPIAQNPILVKGNESCIHTKFEVPPRDGNDFAVPVLVHTPKALEGKQGIPAIIYAHGGGVVGGSAEMFQPWLAHAADHLSVVYFNVDYRLAPETKCPKNALDFYCAVKHIIEHAAEFGVDPTRIAIAGDSGGGYIVMATNVMLAQKDEGHLVKLAIPSVPMMDDYSFGDPKSMTREERQEHRIMRKVWECIATDIEEQRKNSDPLLFPAKADDEVLAKMPPTIIWEVEFDAFITEATRMAARLRAAGRLLELYIAPGATHGSEAEPGLSVTKKMMDDYKLALETYLF